MKFARLTIALALLCWAAPVVAATAYFTPLPSVAAMKALGAQSKFVSNVITISYYGDGNGGGGEYTWDAVSTVNDCAHVAATGVATGRWVLNSASKIISVKQCGAKGDGSTDDYQPFYNTYQLINSSGLGGTLYIPCGTYAISTDETYNSPFVPSALTTTQGESQDCAIIQAIGTIKPMQEMFTVNNPNDVWFKDMTFSGVASHIPAASGAGGAIYFHMTSGAGSDASNFGLENVTLRDITANYWVRTQNDSAFVLRQFRGTNIKVLSFNGNNPDPTTNTVPSAVFSFQGQILNNAGLIQDIVLDKSDGDGSWIKQFAIFWSGTEDGIVSNSTLRNFGANTNPVTSGYAVMAYFNTGSTAGGGTCPNRIGITNTNILGVHDNGYYAAAACNVYWDGGTCSGQNTSGGSLTPACIGWNGVIGQNKISHVNFEDNLTALWVQMGASSTLNLSSSTIFGSGANQIGAEITSCTGSTCPSASDATTQYFLSDTRVRLTGTGSTAVEARSNSGSAVLPGVINISGGNYHAENHVIHMIDIPSGSGIVTTGVFMDNTFLSGASDASTTLFWMNATSSLVSVKNTTFDCATCSSASGGLYLPGETNVSLADNLFQNRPTGTGAILFLNGANGSMRGSQFKNIGSTSLMINSTDFGVALPTWSAQQSTFIQNVFPSGAGHLHGYTNTSSGSGTTWVED